MSVLGILLSQHVENSLDRLKIQGRKMYYEDAVIQA